VPLALYWPKENNKRNGPLFHFSRMYVRFSCPGHNSETTKGILFCVQNLFGEHYRVQPALVLYDVFSYIYMYTQNKTFCNYKCQNWLLMHYTTSSAIFAYCMNCSRQGLRILSCEEAIQLAYRTLVVTYSGAWNNTGLNQ
jgi:hypothetical protein